MFLLLILYLSLSFFISLRFSLFLDYSLILASYPSLVVSHCLLFSYMTMDPKITFYLPLFSLLSYLCFFSPRMNFHYSPSSSWPPCPWCVLLDFTFCLRLATKPWLRPCMKWRLTIRTLQASQWKIPMSP